MTFELFGIVKSKGKKIAVGDNGIFTTNKESIINKLLALGFKPIEEKKEELKEEIEAPKKKAKVK